MALAFPLFHSIYSARSRRLKVNFLLLNPARLGRRGGEGLRPSSKRYQYCCFVGKRVGAVRWSEWAEEIARCCQVDIFSSRWEKREWKWWEEIQLGSSPYRAPSTQRDSNTQKNAFPLTFIWNCVCDELSYKGDEEEGKRKSAERVREDWSINGE